MLLAASFLAVAQAGSAAPPDIEISARVSARDVKIAQQGRAEARVHVEPSAGQRIEVERNLPKGQSHYRNLDIKVNVEARLADPAAAPAVNAAASTQIEPQQGD